MARVRHDPHKALLRLLYAGITGVVSGFLTWDQGAPFGLLFAWNAAAVVLLGLSWLAIAGSTPAGTRKRAAAEDPGRTLVYVIVLIAASVSLLAAVVLSRQAKTLAPDMAHRMGMLCLMTVAVSWALLHSAFTLRYARLYYRQDKEGVGGVEFPGKQEPSYFDFAYFSFTIGMCFQTSDVCVTGHQIRRAVLLHAIISFAYNTAILAFVLTLVFGQA
jgi:uncharacterized membrane protein